MVKLALKAIAFILVALVLIYQATFWVLPSVTINNQSNLAITSSYIFLPQSKLDFGELENNKTNTLHYQLQQIDGVYRYQLTLQNKEPIEGECGYITSNEIHKRVEIVLTSNYKILCNTQ